MVAPLVLSVLALLVVAGLVWAALTHERADETERFNRAREITTSWADPSLTADRPEGYDYTGERADAPEAVLVPDDGRDRRHR
jgi:hypothetical protein